MCPPEKEKRQSNAILFFDEADALFGKRSEVQDSHNRYANIEISYLLQKVEENGGIVILASNLSQNINDAFLRRMHFTVEFPFLEEEYRYKIWKSLFPVEAPLSDDIDYGFLARRFKLAGGNIKNIVVNAAFLAAENSGLIAMEDVINAAKREFQKIGEVCSQSEFGKYYELICKE
jgi:SpoVK/Ycf46/Vps4 family AAA+-type ATPase